ncbi:TPA: MFS transporter [Streptococcus pyogenes]|uniref:MFS transporter n=2 Tax=Streptococcus pyogenes TaxID=1314 RepID=UPI00109D4BE3|nr:MFS transporter [Streptococcus pyogenes]VGQ31273.1 sugar (and other) transporter family protein [Streptococcus pyogenes]VGV77256.1 sugar (and other) transporter family protein [Streptococcus pyogenes]VHB47965.1 sugar (and other) transporter family protein [Streptococcus pyogenes]VHC11890.1 sugar (and other) transporter family protein [Streptococcus pyogenes]VHD80230.1 sugar (and other) transporter family protein [Streptococcus pyogenes]
MSTLSLDTTNKRALVAAIAASGTDDLNVMFLAFSMSSIMTDLGLSGTQGGWIATITNLGMLVGGLLFGLLADRHHKFKVFKWTILLFSVATGLIYFTQSLPYLYLMRFIAGIGVGGEYGVAIAIMAGIVPPEKMGRMSSLNGIAGQLGSISSALLAGWLAPSLGWRGLFLFGLLPILLVIWMTLAIDDQKIWDHYGQEEEECSQPIKINELFKTKSLTAQTLALMVMTTVQIAGYFGMMNWLPTIIQTSLNLSVKSSSLWMVATIVGMCLGMLCFGQLLDCFGPRLIYSLFLLASSICVYLFQFANSMASMVIGGAIVGFFVNGMFAGYGAMITRLYPHHIRSTANNVILNVGRALGGFSSVAIGSILDASGISMVMIFLASLYVISIGAMWTIGQLKAERYQQLRYQRDGC